MTGRAERGWVVNSISPTADIAGGTGGSEAQPGRWAAACTTDEVGEDFPTRVELEDGLAIAVYRVDGAFYATNDRCTHGEASLSDGLVDGHVIECPFHSGTFDIRTGKALTFPCTEPVAVYPVRLEGDRILVWID